MQPSAPKDCRECLKPFRHGDIVARAEIRERVKDGEEPKVSYRIVCMTCAQKISTRASAVVYGGGKSSSIAKARAAKNLKKLERYDRRKTKAKAN